MKLATIVMALMGFRLFRCEFYVVWGWCCSVGCIELVVVMKLATIVMALMGCRLFRGEFYVVGGGGVVTLQCIVGVVV